jgi:transposase-like protein
MGLGMPRPYSTDLRERALRACARGRVTRARIAALFGVGETPLYRWQQGQTRQAAEGRPRGGPAPG